MSTTQSFSSEVSVSHVNYEERDREQNSLEIG